MVRLGGYMPCRSGLFLMLCKVDRHLIFRLSYPHSQISRTPQHALGRGRATPRCPRAILPSRPESLPTRIEYLIHKLPTPQHRPIRKLADPVAHHLPHRHRMWLHIMSFSVFHVSTFIIFAIFSLVLDKVRSS
jgi:hypothetical protein